MSIKGINKSEYPVLYAVVERNMKAYGITKVNVKIVADGTRAYTYSRLEDYLCIPKRHLENLNEQELEAIVAHEFSHISNRDSFRMRCIILLFFIPSVVLIALIVFKPNRVTSDPLHFYFILILFIFSVYMSVLGLKIKNKVSVRQERRADLEAILKTRNPCALRNALFKTTIELIYTTYDQPSYFNAFDSCIDNILWCYFGDTHPAITERLGYLEVAERMFKEQEIKNTDMPIIAAT